MTMSEIWDFLYLFQFLYFCFLDKPSSVNSSKTNNLIVWEKLIRGELENMKGFRNCDK